MIGHGIHCSTLGGLLPKGRPLLFKASAASHFLARLPGLCPVSPPATAKVSQSNCDGRAAFRQASSNALEFPSPMSPHVASTVCFHCRETLTEIDYYGERLIGCVECNRWGRLGDKRLVMELMEEDIESLVIASSFRRLDRQTRCMSAAALVPAHARQRRCKRPQLPE